jgi:hypothetical protein
MIDLAQLPIFPCNLAKEPLSVHGFKSARSGAKWKHWPLVGFPTGAKSGIDVLDIDPSGRDWYDANFDALPTTLAHETQRGLHLLFKHGAGLRCSSNKIADGVDVRADGGYAIYWPSTGLPIDDAPICEWPDWLLAEVMGPRIEQGRDRYSQGPYQGAPSRWGGVATLNPNRRSAALMRKVESAQRGNRNSMLNWASYHFGRMIVEGFIKRSVVEELLRSAAWVNGLWREDGPAQCRATIKSGIDAGMNDARDTNIHMVPMSTGPSGQPRSRK